MILPFLALAVVMSNSLIDVAPSNWSAIELPVRQHETTIDGDFEVIRGSKVQIIIASREEAERLHRGRSFRPVYTSGFREEGRFRIVVSEAGEYVLLVDNRVEGRTTAQVRLNVTTSNRISIDARELPPARRRAVVALSLLFFGSVVAFSAWQFLRNSEL